MSKVLRKMKGLLSVQGIKCGGMHCEKKLGIMRVSTVVHRHEEFQFGKEVKILQSLNIGQPLMEIQWSTDKEDEKEK